MVVMRRVDISTMMTLSVLMYVPVRRLTLIDHVTNPGLLWGE